MNSEDRIERIAIELLTIADREEIERVFDTSGDVRVSEKDAARLIGLSHGGLKHMRQEDEERPLGEDCRAPECVPTGKGLRRCRYSYRLTALAQWIDDNRPRLYAHLWQEK
ncbi:MAG TPA: hypothetical protein VJ673_24485 [Aromatoleum sp.]|uniref:hypothetical protein n=1 Tax=Aromatoleum sp. TaxID=2307007 RepID=UPI002B48F515|nr:hypothetical protein [Aromatoleum sp.]HJV28856.1 hypothetical protein [Aromatoleum sp.]